MERDHRLCAEPDVDQDMLGQRQDRDRQRGPGPAQELAGGAAERAGQREQPCDHQDRILVSRVEQVRREQAGKDPAEHAAERCPEIEFGQARRLRTAPIDLAVAEQRQDEQHQQVDADRQDPEFVVDAELHDREENDHERRDAHDDLVPEPGPVAEHPDERQEIERERQDPEQRRRRNIG